MTKLIYVCSPYGGLEENYKKALFYGRYVASKGCIPVIPHTMLHGVYDDRVATERKAALEAGRCLLKFCDEVWVFGTAVSSGMRGEISFASDIGKPVRHIKDTFTLNDNTEKLSVILHEYESLTGNTANRMILDDVLYYLNGGLTEELIIEAIKTTARKSAGWNYCRAILQRCLNSGKTTKEQFEKKPNQSTSTGAAYDLDLFERMLNEKE